MRKIFAVIVLECYALMLAVVQHLGGVRTDEAKYLLNIPYPHPPLARFLLGLTDALPFQEMLWRIVFATLVVQSAWLLWDIAGATISRKIAKLGVGLLWLAVGGVVLQAGAIMMAPLTAVQGLVFAWLLLKQRNGRDLTRWSGWIALFWLASVFTAYQAVLYAPIAAAVFWKMRLPDRLKVAAFAAPLAALALFTITQPLLLFSLVNAGGQNAGIENAESLRRALTLWVIGGSAIVSALGLISMIRERSWPLMLSMLLVFAYVMVSYRPYYSILFTPLLLAGVALRPAVVTQPISKVFLTASISALIAIVSPFGLSIGSTVAHDIAAVLPAPSAERDELLIAGPFGHEWQYETWLGVRRYHPDLLDHAAAVVCLDKCEGIAEQGFHRTFVRGVQVWIWDQSL